MPEIEMFVSLVIPDNTAITAQHTLKKMGYGKLLNIKREVYYRFSFNGDLHAFQKKVSQIDILANHNKNRVEFKKPNQPFPDNRTRILVKNTGDRASGLFHSLKGSMGLTGLKKVETGTLWILAIDDKPENVTPLAWDIARKLLYNKHYQTAEILAKR